MNFKVGDRVICIEGCDPTWASVREGEVYTVQRESNILGNAVYLEGISKWVYARRFELIEETPAPGFMELFQ